jgi:hypothetical protein
MSTRISPQALLGIILLVTIQVVLLGYTQNTLERRNERLLDSFRSHGMALYEVQVNALQLRRYEKDYFLAANDAAERPRYAQLWRDHKSMLDNNISLLQKSGEFSAVELKEFQQWVTLVGNYASDFERAMQSVEAEIGKDGRLRDIVASYAAMGEARKAIRVVIGNAQVITDQQFAWLNQSSGSIKTANRVLILVSCLIAAAISWMIVLAANGSFRIRRPFRTRRMASN